MIKATITAIHMDGAFCGWPGQRVVREEGEDGSWGWRPGDEELRQETEVEAPPRFESDTILDGQDMELISLTVTDDAGTEHAIYTGSMARLIHRWCPFRNVLREAEGYSSQARI